MNRTGSPLLAAGLLLSLYAFSATSPTIAKQGPKAGHWILGERRTSRSYTFRSYGRSGRLGGYFEILRNGKRVYKRSGGNFMVDRQGGSGKLLIGKDITGDGQPDLVVLEFGRGAHGPYYSHIFQIGDRFRHIATIEGEDDQIVFDDLSKDGRMEAVLRDWTFAYWNAPLSDSPAPRVVLRYGNGRYVPDTHLMRKPVPSSDVIDRTAKAVAAGLGEVKAYPCNDPGDQPPSELWRMMLDLIYTGHADTAWALLDQAWPTDVPGKQRFIEDFRRQLTRSRFWPAIREMSVNQ